MVIRRIRRATGKWWVVLPAAAAVACGGGPSAGTAEAAASTGVAAQGSAASPPSALSGAWPDLDPAQLLERARALLDATPDGSSDVGAVAANLGGDLAQTLAFVRDGFAFDPYRGCLRGAVGTLHARAGNALDRSLLLAELLEAGGHTVRLVRGRLSPEAASELVRHAASVPTAAAPPAAGAPEDSETAKLLADAAPVHKVAADLARRTTEAIERRVQTSLALIARSLKDAGVTVSSETVTTEDVQNHVWVQVLVESDWKDLDSSFPTGIVGRSFAKPEGSPIEPTAIPDEWFQRLRVRLTAEYRGRRPEVVLDKDWTVRELLLGTFGLGFLPKDSPDPTKATVFQPAITLGTNVTSGQSIDLRPGSFQRLQLDVMLNGPGLPEARASRTVAAASTDPKQGIAELRQQIDTIYQFFAAPSPVPIGWVVRQQQTLLEYMTQPDGREPPPVSVDLLNLVRVMVDGDQQTGRARAFVPRPIVVSQRLGITGSGTTRKIVKSFDILHNRTHFLGGDPMLAVRQGVFETELERAVFSSGEVFNTSTVFERSSGPALVLKAGEQQKLAGLNLPAEMTRLVAEDLAAGFVVLVPPSPVQIGSRPVTGWWRIRPTGGETLGRMENGEGQGMIEKAITMALTAIPSIYAFAAGRWCTTTTGICNPCLIAFAGFVGTVIGLHNFAVGGGFQLAWRGLNLNVPAGVVYGATMGLGAYGGWGRAAKCGDFLFDWASGS